MWTAKKIDRVYDDFTTNMTTTAHKVLLTKSTKTNMMVNNKKQVDFYMAHILTQPQETNEDFL